MCDQVGAPGDLAIPLLLSLGLLVAIMLVAKIVNLVARRPFLLNGARYALWIFLACVVVLIANLFINPNLTVRSACATGNALGALLPAIGLAWLYSGRFRRRKIGIPYHAPLPGS